MAFSPVQNRPDCPKLPPFGSPSEVLSKRFQREWQAVEPLGAPKNVSKSAFRVFRHAPLLVADCPRNTSGPREGFPDLGRGSTMAASHLQPLMLVALGIPSTRGPTAGPTIHGAAPAFGASQPVPTRPKTSARSHGREDDPEPRIRGAAAATIAMPKLLTVPEVAELLRTSPKAIYTQIHRGQLPGVVRLSRRVLINSQTLLQWLSEKHAVSLTTTQGNQR